jgi:hypothetical protein
LAAVYFDHREKPAGTISIYKSGDQGIELLKNISFDASNLLSGHRFKVELRDFDFDGAIEAEVSTESSTDEAEG